MAYSKRMKTVVAAVDPGRSYALQEAVELLKSVPGPKFDESVDLAVNLGVDPKHADQMVRGGIVLPHGTGKTVRVLVFAKGEKEKEARDAGADHVGGDELAKKIQEEDWLDFDRVIATPDMMAVVGRLGKVLGPRGLMPNPKLGSVTADVAAAVKAAKGGQVEFRVEKAGIVQAGVGKASFDEAALLANVRALIDAVQKAKPTGVKGTYLKKLALSSTMGPGVRVDLATIQG